MNCLMKICICLLLCMGGEALMAQQIRGQVLGLNGEGREERLPGAQLLWLGTSVGTVTDVDGIFQLPRPKQFPAHLLIQFAGYATDTIPYTLDSPERLRIVLEQGVDIKTFEVKEKVAGTQLSTRPIVNVESIGQKELKRAACCDLSESFESSATVDVSFSDAVTGTKAIKLLGLDGQYAQISVENIPFIRGLSATTGLLFIPGTWLKSINITKGVGPIGTGVNSMTGQVELRLLAPPDEPPIFVNLYGNTRGRIEANVHLRHQLSEKWQGLTLVHGNLRRLEVDQNNDGFLDSPITERLNVLSSWSFQSENREAKFGLRVVDDRRRGGQLGILRSEANPVPQYRTDLNDRLIDLWAKHGWVWKKDPTKSIGLIFSARQHEVKNSIGLRNYRGEEQSLYGNIIFQTLLGDGTDQLKAGLTTLIDDFDQQFNDSLFARTEIAPGAFIEHTWKQTDWALVSSLRVDHHRPFSTQVSPRIHFKYDFHPLTALRFSAGKAYRSANPFVDRISYLVSSRAVQVEGPLELEESWNASLTFLHKWKWFERKFAVNIDLIRTEFVEQVVTDVEDPTLLRFYMLEGNSFSNSLLVDLQVELSERIDLKLAYRYYDAQTTFRDGQKQNPFTPQHRGLVDLAYADLEEKWRVDASWNLFGSTRVPDTRDVFVTRSPTYGKLNTQITRVFGSMEVYFGAENLLGVQQEEQIISLEDPFGANFDASMIWGLVTGRNVYGGIRWKLGEPE